MAIDECPSQRLVIGLGELGVGRSLASQDIDQCMRSRGGCLSDRAEGAPTRPQTAYPVSGISASRGQLAIHARVSCSWPSGSIRKATNSGGFALTIFDRLARRRVTRQNRVPRQRGLTLVTTLQAVFFGPTSAPGALP